MFILPKGDVVGEVVGTKVGMSVGWQVGIIVGLKIYFWYETFRHNYLGVGMRVGSAVSQKVYSTIAT